MRYKVAATVVMDSAEDANNLYAMLVKLLKLMDGSVGVDYMNAYINELDDDNGSTCLAVFGNK